MAEPMKYCETCGAKMVRYKHSLCKGIVNGLLRFAKFGPHPQRLCDKGKLAGGMTRNAADNFQKLKYFGIVVKAPPDGEAQHSGWWQITQRGWDFIRGTKAMPSFMWTYRGEVVDESTELVSIHEIKHDPYYLQWGDYVAESEGHP